MFFVFMYRYNKTNFYGKTTLIVTNRIGKLFPFVMLQKVYPPKCNNSRTKKTSLISVVTNRRVG